MVELTNNNSFYKEHLEDVLPSNIVDPESVIVDDVIEDENMDIYEIIFMIFIVVFTIFMTILIYRKMISRRKYVRK